MIFLRTIQQNTYICQIKSHTKKKAKFHPFFMWKGFSLVGGVCNLDFTSVGFLLWEGLQPRFLFCGRGLQPDFTGVGFSCGKHGMIL